MPTLILACLIAAPIVLLVLWLLADDAIVNVEPGHLGLLLVHGRATDKVLPPGIHVVARLRRRMLAVYPSLEMAYRAGQIDTEPDEFEHHGPPLRTFFGDKMAGTVGFTVRFRLDPAQLKAVHERYGTQGIWSAVRDLAAPCVRSTLMEPSVTVDDLFGPSRHELEARVQEALAQRLGAHGFTVSSFFLEEVDLGRSGDAIQAAVRARLELAREQAESEMRIERARRDAEVAAVLAGVQSDPALRYRETDAWRDLMAELAKGPVALSTRRESSSSRPPAREPAPTDREAGAESGGSTE